MPLPAAVAGDGGFGIGVSDGFDDYGVSAEMGFKSQRQLRRNPTSSAGGGRGSSAVCPLKLDEGGNDGNSEDAVWGTAWEGDNLAAAGDNGGGVVPWEAAVPAGGGVDWGKVGDTPAPVASGGGWGGADLGQQDCSNGGNSSGGGGRAKDHVREDQSRENSGGGWGSDSKGGDDGGGADWEDSVGEGVGGDKSWGGGQDASWGGDQVDGSGAPLGTGDSSDGGGWTAAGKSLSGRRGMLATGAGGAESAGSAPKPWRGALKWNEVVDSVLIPRSSAFSHKGGGGRGGRCEAGSRDRREKKQGEMARMVELDDDGWEKLPLELLKVAL